ncbi:hypothetical protein ABZ864_47155 [Streptomyces sp. NPDC047082]|uniref:hypothetical protein n=1 Tax=Streptomyces sp. NPDC047082 TaxID=3155259 RepID=UPI00340D5BCB
MAPLTWALMSDKAVTLWWEGEAELLSRRERRRSRRPSIRIKPASTPGTQLPTIAIDWVDAPERSTPSSNQQSSSQKA